MKIFFDKKMLEINIPHNDHTKILPLLWENSLYNTNALCSGVGKCGKCKILYQSTPPTPSQDEIEILQREEIDAGIRLSCKHNAKNDDIIKLLEENKSEAANFNERKYFTTIEDGNNAFSCLALDFGTTSLEYTLFSENSVKGHGKYLNPMQGIGAEIMARLQFALENKNTKNNAALIKNRVCLCLQNIIKEAEEHNSDIKKIIFSANSAMTYLSLGLDAKILAKAPYSLDYKGGSTFKLSDIIDEIFINNKELEIYIPPLLAPFIGADISAGLYFINKKIRPQYPYFFIDMGTNAEFVLALSEDSGIMASVPLGPSVEGVGLTFGTVAKNNAIVDFTLTPAGLKEVLLDANSAKSTDISGITGVGYLHLLQNLSKIGIIDKEGHFDIQASLPLARKISQFITLEGKMQADALKLGNTQFHLTMHDIESILMVKAAFRAAFEILFQEAQKITPLIYADIQQIYIAGAFGKHLKKETLTDLGFLPHALLSKIEQVGNTSLKGAELLCDTEKCDEIQKQFKAYHAIELANHKDFSKNYIENFHFKTF